jgi:hypothetical protein
MAKAKTPRTTTPSNKQVITMPEAGSLPQIRKASSAAPTPIDLESQIRTRAYQLSEERGFAAGHETDDWFQAEREVRARHNQQHTA